ncbi:hypothetical protein ACFQE1_17050 [Halobium palmae]|uniref:Uncharacterized protein n=1 Tax=Halobium palmae TaxID=1776492 RepID=A0ABD5S3C4_9EURY
MADATERLVDTFREFGGDGLRDVWLFDQWAHQRLYVRDDVAAVVDDVDVDAVVDNERYGYVTRDTYETLYYAEYEFTVRGFSSFDQFRTFLDDGTTRVGVFASFDRDDAAPDFRGLYDAISGIESDVPVAEFTPVDATD